MNVNLKLTNQATRASSTYTLKEFTEWTILVNRLIIKAFGMSAAENRQDLNETDWPRRIWRGIIDGQAWQIEETEIPEALTAVTEAAEVVREAAATLAQAQSVRDEAVRTALTEGIPIEALVPASGLSRERLYQIRDGRR